MGRLAEARILVVDDEPDVLEGYRRIFNELLVAPADDIASLAGELFPSATPSSSRTTTIAAVDLCRQGEDAVRYLENKHAEGSHYPVAFIDMRMPPGIDGLETARRLRQFSPELNIVVVTGYSDRPPRQIASEIGITDRFFYLVKPFNPDELLQLATTLINRWETEQDAAETLARKTAELELANAAAMQTQTEAEHWKEQLDQLRLRVSGTGGVASHNLDRTGGDARGFGEHLNAAERCSSDALDAAFHQGCAASTDPTGLALCPYSAITESEQFSAWVAGYRSKGD